MNFLRRISQARRITFSFALVAVLIAAIGGISAWQLRAAGAASAATAIAAATVATIVLLTLFGIVFRRSITDPVEYTVACVTRIAGGDLETKVESTGKDEFSWLQHELNQMRKKLRTAMLEVRQTVETVNVASEEIARGNADLSSRTESQASALQETASSMHALAATVQVNAEHTREASNVVTQSSEVAQRGAELMKSVVGRMGEINASASRISEIIGVIDGIAFQTNILALNAAVEAARAGEHGRGFAVVASEVRSLAQRSSTAAREIKTLIGDSTEKVDAGSKLVDEAGRTMQDILDSVTKVSRLMSDIADSGRSQTTGINEVHQAVAQIDSVTQQNAALVEQVAAAAQSLQGQAGRLSETMSAFKVAA